MKLTLMEQHFFEWYELNIKRIGNKIHRYFNKNCKSCFSNDKLYVKLLNKKETQGGSK